METLSHICHKTEEAFKKTYSGLKLGALEKVAEDWINGNEQVTILGYSIIPGDKLYIAIKNSPAPGKPMFDRYYILRFFPGGKECWNCSEDLGSKTESEFIQFMIKKMK